VTTSLVPVSQVSLRRIRLGVKSLLQVNPHTSSNNDASLKHGSSCIACQSPSMWVRALLRMEKHHERGSDGPSACWMMGGAIEDDQGSRYVIDFAVHGFDSFVAVT
jgi:hypothetical protein